MINGKAEIPNFLLQDTHAVTVYAYSGSIENGYTMAEKTFNVAKKPKPANYVETKEDQAILAKLKADIGDLTALQTEAKDNLVAAINEAAAVDDHASGSSDFVVNASLDDNNNCTVDKTYAQIQEAVQAGKKPVVRLAQGGSTITMPLGSGGDGAFIFSVIVGVMETVSALVTISVQDGNEVAYIFTYVPVLNPSNGTFNQVEMNEDPKEAMEIATKQYVDNKEFILQSTTPNSTKKFKITVDDTGVLTATEVTS